MQNPVLTSLTETGSSIYVRIAGCTLLKRKQDFLLHSSNGIAKLIIGEDKLLLDKKHVSKDCQGKKIRKEKRNKH